MSRRFVLLFVLLVVLVSAVVGGAVGASAADTPMLPSAPGATRAPTPESGRGATAAALGDDPPLGQTPVLDSFNRPNGSLGQNWARFHGPGTLVIQGNVVHASGGLAASYWTPEVFGADQEAYYYDTRSLDVNLGNLRLFVRLTDPDADGGWNGYELLNQSYQLVTTPARTVFATGSMIFGVERIGWDEDERVGKWRSIGAASFRPFWFVDTTRTLDARLSAASR